MLLNKEVYITISHTPLKIDQHFPFKTEFSMSIKLNHSLEVALSKMLKMFFQTKAVTFITHLNWLSLIKYLWKTINLRICWCSKILQAMSYWAKLRETYSNSKLQRTLSIHSKHLIPHVYSRSKNSRMNTFEHQWSGEC